MGLGKWLTRNCSRNEADRESEVPSRRLQPWRSQQAGKKQAPRNFHSRTLGRVELLFLMFLAVCLTNVKPSRKDS